VAIVLKSNIRGNMIWSTNVRRGGLEGGISPMGKQSLKRIVGNSNGCQGVESFGGGGNNLFKVASKNRLTHIQKGEEIMSKKGEDFKLGQKGGFREWE